MADSIVPETAGDLKPPDTVTTATTSRVAEDGALTVFSRKTDRLRKKHEKKMRSPLVDPAGFLDLSCDLLLDILTLLQPSDVVRLSRTCKALFRLVTDEETVLAAFITRWRYPSLARCLALPVRVQDVDPAAAEYLASPERQHIMTVHKRGYQHVLPPDQTALCTCLTCLLRWNSLCLAVDFAHWQDNLDAGWPIPVIPRGRTPEWNEALVERNAAVVRMALRRPLIHARILEAHLASTCRSIRRHSENKGNQRRRFRMTKEDEQAGTDAFLERSGPPTVDFPYHRDNYYMLEAYLPNRSWNSEESAWAYVPADQHDRDVQFVGKLVELRRGNPKAQKSRMAQAEKGELDTESPKQELDAARVLHDTSHTQP